MTERTKKILYCSLAVAIIASGVFIRFWKLDTIPPGVHYDEAFNGLNALAANANHDWKIFYTDNTGREGLHINVIAFFINIFGNNNLGLRFANALWGSLTIIGFYFLLRELKFSRLSILAGTFMISFSFWHLVFSRTAYRAIMVPLVLVWMFYFLWKAINNPEKRILNFILSGIFLGIGFHTYISFRIAPVIFLSLGGAFAVTKKNLAKRHWKLILVFALAFLVAAMPIFLYFSSHWKDFVSRSEAVSVFNAPNMTFGQAFGKSLGRHLLAFVTIGDHNPRHNYHDQPLLPAAWAVLFAIGFLISLKEIVQTFINSFKKINQPVTKWFYISILAQSIFWIMLLPGILSIEGIPHSLRIIGSIPAVFIISILPLEYILSMYREIKRTPHLSKKSQQGNKFLTVFVGLVGMVVFGGISQVYIYFNLWANDLATLGAYERKLYDFGFLMKDLSLHQNNYLVTAFNTAISSDRKQSSLKTMEYIGYPHSQNYIYYRPLEGFSQISCDDPQVVFLESDQWLRDQYKSKCPDLKAKKYQYDNGKYVFWAMNYNQ